MVRKDAPGGIENRLLRTCWYSFKMSTLPRGELMAFPTRTKKRSTRGSKTDNLTQEAVRQTIEHKWPYLISSPRTSSGDSLLSAGVWHCHLLHTWGLDHCRHVACQYGSLQVTWNRGVCGIFQKFKCLFHACTQTNPMVTFMHAQNLTLKLSRKQTGPIHQPYPDMR